MNIQYLLPGLALAALGFVVWFGLLASVSALAKSRQFGAMRTLASGQAGAAKRGLFFFALVAMAFGTCGVFGGVARSDRDRARACQRACVDRGYAEGRIGPSAHPDPKRPVPACACTGGPNGSTPFEMRADDLAY